MQLHELCTSQLVCEVWTAQRELGTSAPHGLGPDGAKRSRHYDAEGDEDAPADEHERGVDAAELRGVVLRHGDAAAGEGQRGGRFPFMLRVERGL